MKKKPQCSLRIRVRASKHLVADAAAPPPKANEAQEALDAGVLKEHEHHNTNKKHQIPFTLIARTPTYSEPKAELPNDYVLRASQRLVRLKLRDIVKLAELLPQSSGLNRRHRYVRDAK